MTRFRILYCLAMAVCLISGVLVISLDNNTMIAMLWYTAGLAVLAYILPAAFVYLLAFLPAVLWPGTRTALMGLAAAFLWAVGPHFYAERHANTLTAHNAAGDFLRPLARLGSTVELRFASAVQQDLDCTYACRQLLLGGDVQWVRTGSTKISRVYRAGTGESCRLPGEKTPPPRCVLPGVDHNTPASVVVQQTKHEDNKQLSLLIDNHGLEVVSVLENGAEVARITTTLVEAARPGSLLLVQPGGVKLEKSGTTSGIEPAEVLRRVGYRIGTVADDEYASEERNRGLNGPPTRTETLAVMNIVSGSAPVGSSTRQAVVYWTIRAREYGDWPEARVNLLRRVYSDKRFDKALFPHRFNQSPQVARALIPVLLTRLEGAGDAAAIRAAKVLHLEDVRLLESYKSQIARIVSKGGPAAEALSGAAAKLGIGMRTSATRK